MKKFGRIWIFDLVDDTMKILSIIEISEFPAIIQEDLLKTNERYNQNDFSGAITSICGAIDKLVADIYAKRNIGDPHVIPFQEKVKKSFTTFERSFKINLRVSQLRNNEIKELWDHYSKSVHQASCVLGTFRNEFSDAHGHKYVPNEFFRMACDCGVFILKSFGLQEKMFNMKHPYDKVSQDVKLILQSHFVKPKGQNIIFFSHDEINKEFRGISFGKIESQLLERKNIINDKGDLTEDGIKIIKEIAREIASN